MLAWADAHPVSDPNALEQVLHLWSRSGLNEQLWSLLRMHQQRQNNHLRRSEPAGTWRTRGSGSGDRREDGAEAGETFTGMPLGGPSVAAAVAVLSTGAAGTTPCRVRRRGRRQRALPAVAGRTVAMRDLLVLKGRPPPVVFWTDAVCL